MHLCLASFPMVALTLEETTAVIVILRLHYRMCHEKKCEKPLIPTLQSANLRPISTLEAFFFFED